MLRNPVPFLERDSARRPPLELLTARPPAFLFGARLGSILPVFTFRQVTVPYLEPFLVYLLENNYRTLTADEAAAYVAGTLPHGPPAVVLHFDNAWASLWTVVAPLLRRYNQSATAFAIPGRTPEADTPRPVWGQPGHDPDADRSDRPFCTWPELRALAADGRISIQSNTWSHAKIFCNETFQRLILPETVLPHLSWPVISDPGEPLKRLGASSVFHPLLPARSRMSDALKHDVDPSVVRRIHDDPNAAPYLFRQHFLQIETPEERTLAIQYELHRSREDLAHRLQTPVRHLALPWGIAGSVTRSLLPAAGYDTVFGEFTGGFRALQPGQNPHRLLRLDHTCIPCLPGRPRKPYWRISRP